jgi:butyrate kinase
MKEPLYLFILNPGSTSTKVAVYRDEECLAEETIPHHEKKVDILEELPQREADIRAWLAQHPFPPFHGVVARGGLLKPIPSGTYVVSERMLDDLRHRPQAIHASNLGAFMADRLAREWGVPAWIVDPVSVDEFNSLARYSGWPEIRRRALSHALNIRAVARRVATVLGTTIEGANFVVAHLGGGISVVPLERGRIVDANDANQGGPFSPERTGALPIVDLLHLAYSGKYTEKELVNKLTRQGGLQAYLGTHDAREVEGRIAKGDAKAREVYAAMAYQVAKEIGAMATVVRGQVLRVILTGGLAKSQMLVDMIGERVRFIAPVEVVPGEGEMIALAQGGSRVLRGQEEGKSYD